MDQIVSISGAHMKIQQVSENDTLGPPRGEAGFLDDHLAYLLARASLLIAQPFHRQLLRAGLSVPIWRVLACLADRNSLTVTDLADLSLLKQPTLTKVLDRMERQDLVRRTVDEDDRRRVLVRLTMAGRKQAETLLLQARGAERNILSILDSTRLAGLKQDLRLVIDRMEQQHPKR